MRIVLYILLKMRQKHIFAEGSADANGDLPDAETMYLAKRFLAAGNCRECVSQFFHQDSSFRSQLHASGIAIEQRRVQKLFQFGNRFADSRLTDIELFRSQGDIACFGCVIENMI